MVSGTYNITYVLFDGINTVTQSFTAQYTQAPTCLTNFSPIDSTDLLFQDHSFTFNVAPNTFQDLDGQALTISLDTAIMTPAAFAGTDSDLYSLASGNLLIDV